MDAKKKEAYRFLLYWALIEIRPIQWYFRIPDVIIRPFTAFSLIKDVQEKGAVADWLHNLALFSSLDFEGFDEQLFWKDWEYFQKKYPETFLRLNSTFHVRLQELNDCSPSQMSDLK